MSWTLVTFCTLGEDLAHAHTRAHSYLHILPTPLLLLPFSITVLATSLGSTHCWLNGCYSLLSPVPSFFLYICLVFYVIIAKFFSNDPTALSNMYHFFPHLCSLYSDFSLGHISCSFYRCVFVSLLLLSCHLSGLSGGREYKLLWSFCHVWVQILCILSPLKEAILL